MFSSPFFSECFDTPTDDQKDDELRHEQEISILPRHEGWRNLSLRLYKDFWFPEAILPGVLSLRHHLRPSSSDIFLASFPKSGTTWLKALAFAITTRNPELLQSRHPQDCSPNLETFFSGHRVPDLDALPSPRQFSTHIPYSVLPKSVQDSPCRIIYLCRDPKDTLVSTFHFVNGMRRPESAPQMALTEAVELFCKGLTVYGPVWEHQLEYWKESQRRPEKVMFIKFEDLMADPEVIVRRMAEYMGKPFSAEEEMKGMVGEIVGRSSFEELSGLEINKVGFWGKEFDLGHLAIKKSSFFRNGKVGDWREHFTAEMAERFDAIAREKWHQSGLTYSHSSV